MPLIAIDAGHPSHRFDEGVRVAGLVEAEWTLMMADRLSDYLEHWPVDVLRVREDGEPMSLQERGIATRRAGADLVISLHVNANVDRRVSGLTTFHIDDAGEAVGDRICQAYRREGIYFDGKSVRHRLRSSIKADPMPHWTGRAYNVLRVHTPPCVLVEAGFATNPGDLVELTDRGGQDEILAAILCGLAWWLRR